MAMDVSSWLALAAVVLSCIAFVFTLFTAYQSIEYRHSVDKIEEQVMSLLDEALQIMIPAGICKRICHPGMDVPLDNDDSKVKPTKKRSTIPRHLEYPEDVSVALADEEVIYDRFGIRKSELNYKSTCQKQISLAVKGKKGRDALVKKLKYAAPLQETQYALESKRSEVNLGRRNKFSDQLQETQYGLVSQLHFDLPHISIH
ncbi:hypothetical protein Aduo_016031 [Ancylostoma duodenale]